MKEDQNTEFKKEYSETFLKSVVAFSNTSGGRIIIGIDDDGSEIGVDDPDDTTKRCVNAISDRIRPDATLNTNVTIRSWGGKDFVVIDVSEGEKRPYYLRDKGLRAEGVYVRMGTSSVPITEEGLQMMIRDIRSLSYEEKISFKQDLTFEGLKRIFRENDMVLDGQRMESLGMKDDGRYTNLAFILSDQYDQSIKLASFTDDFRTEFIERYETSGCILVQQEDALAFLRKYNGPSSRIEGTKRVDSYPYSERSLREALLNAITHRDYGMKSPILVSVYPNRITITSPGGMNEYFTMDELLRGVSSLRNRKLANIMYRLKMIEAYGTGIPRIFGSYVSSDTKPEIQNGASSFTITLPSNNSKHVGPEIQRFLTDHDEFTRSELQDVLGLSRSDAVSKLSIMVDSGLIVKVGNGRSTRYKVVKNG